MTRDDLHTSSVDPDVVARGIGFAAKLTDGGAVHRDPSVEHQLLGRAAGGDAGLGENLLQAIHCCSPREQVAPETCQLHDIADMDRPIGLRV